MGSRLSTPSRRARIVLVWLAVVALGVGVAGPADARTRHDERSYYLSLGDSLAYGYQPNLVAAGPLFPYAFTRPECGEGVLRALQDVGGDGMEELAAGERCGITVPSRVAFRESGWDDMLERVKVKKYHFEEQQQVEIPLTHEGRLRDYVFTPEPIARADFFVNCPKFKAHPWTTVTFSMKNYIGIQDDRRGPEPNSSFFDADELMIAWRSAARVTTRSHSSTNRAFMCRARCNRLVRSAR